MILLQIHSWTTFHFCKEVQMPYEVVKCCKMQWSILPKTLYNHSAIFDLFRELSWRYFYRVRIGMLLSRIQWAQISKTEGLLVSRSVHKIEWKFEQRCGSRCRFRGCPLSSWCRSWLTNLLKYHRASMLATHLLVSCCSSFASFF